MRRVLTVAVLVAETIAVPLLLPLRRSGRMKYFNGGSDAISQVGRLILVLMVLHASTSVERVPPVLYLPADRCPTVSAGPFRQSMRILTEAWDLNQKRFAAKIVTSNGIEVWRGAAYRQASKINADIPAILTDSPRYFFRLYADAQYRNLLRETTINVSPGPPGPAPQDKRKQVGRIQASAGAGCPSA